MRSDIGARSRHNDINTFWTRALKAKRPRTLSPRYSYDPRAHRYRDLSTGRFISWRDVRGALDNVLATSAQRMNQISRRLVEREITLADWVRAMQAEIKQSHLIAHVLAAGGWEQMTPARFGRAGREIRTQYEFLRRFAGQIQTGQIKLDGRFLKRAQLYALSARRTHNRQDRDSAQRAGYTEERRVLGQAEHCDDCIRYAERGWSPLGSLPEIGDSECKANCQCHFEYR